MNEFHYFVNISGSPSDPMYDANIDTMVTDRMRKRGISFSLQMTLVNCFCGFFYHHMPKY